MHVPRRSRKRKAVIAKGMPFVSSSHLKINTLFDPMLAEVNRLLEFPDWLPIERFQINFHLQKLEHFLIQYRFLTIRDEDHLSELASDPTLNIIVTKILKHKSGSTSAEFLVQDPLELTHVGNRLAYQVAMIYKATNQGFNKVVSSCLGLVVKSFSFDDRLDLTVVGDTLEAVWRPKCRSLQLQCLRDLKAKDEYLSQDFPSKFYTDKNKFLEQEGEVFVGFQVEASNLLQQLASITRKQLQVISIVGMAGLGKTTLAARLYDHPYVVSYFYVRAWVTFTQIYQKRDLLLAILRSVVEITDEVCKMSDYMLAHALYCALKGRRYLITIDDVWSSDAWDDFKRCFPDDNNGSKIMLTTRLKDVALHAQTDGSPLCLRFLTEEESFDLFRIKTFRDTDLFDNLSLIGIGKSITKKCRGLPLAIVVIAGILKNNFEVDWWESVEESVGSYIITDKNQYMDTLALSYNHLPQHLRYCFLSFGAFPEDHDIPVRKLLWLWVAEGFIHQNGTKNNFEDVAEKYLMDLIQRSLVVVGKKGPNGAMKTCRIHDLLRDLCLRKAEEENFPTDTYQHNKYSHSCSHSSTNPYTKSQLLLSINFLTVPSNCSCYSSEVSQLFFKDVSIIWDTSKLIRALDISSIELLVFPSKLLQLVHLRYLELQFRSGNPPESISELGELQTLIMSSRMNVVVPMKMWKMMNLRHLCIRSGKNLAFIAFILNEASALNLRALNSLAVPSEHLMKAFATL